MKIRNALMGTGLALVLSTFVGLTLNVKSKRDRENSVVDRYKITNYESQIPVVAQVGYSGGISIALGDVNSNGIDELFVADMKTIQMYQNDGEGNFQYPRLIAKHKGYSGYSNAIDLELNDIDKDGDLDLIVGDLEGVAIFKNNGRGEFTQKEDPRNGRLDRLFSDFLKYRSFSN